jgi:N2,N2-dimethylguanosine tRNA methyltransferase
MAVDLAQQPAPISSERDDLHDPVFLEILNRHGFDDRPLQVPLKARYTKPRRWSENELEWAYERWREEASFNEITARLNRNPQDIIFKLIDLCRERGEVFTEKGRNVGSAKWNARVEACANELFAKGLPAWKIALLFDVDFEHCEKRLYAGRADYGHKKKNPFVICTEHKHQLNVAIVKAALPSAKRVFEGYAGEGLSTNGYLDALPGASVVAVEHDEDTADDLVAALDDGKRVEVVRDTARRTLLKRILDNPSERFDLIDLDPFVSCADSIGPALELAKNGTLFFVTFGGEYRRCFIGTNRKSLARRYRAQLFDETNAEALQEMPRFMLGELASQAMTLGLLVEPLVVVRYPMVVRAYLRIKKPKSFQALLDGFNSSVSRDHRGARFDISIPKWREVDVMKPLGAPKEDKPHRPRRRR